MRKFISLSILIMSIFGLFFHDAQAERFGGGKSFGVQRSMQQYARPMSSLSSAASTPFSSAKKWLAPLAGLALGGLLASLFMGHGLGSGILAWLAIGSIIFLLFNLLKRKMQPVTSNLNQARYAENPQPSSPKFTQDQYQREATNYSSSSQTYPVGFNADEFLREAKVKFIRLQSAYDQKNLQDLREFTTPEVFAEIQLQLHERGDQTNKTEIISLDAELLEATTEFQIPVASVRFIGSLREDDSEPSTLNEIWHFRKHQENSTWIVSGVQQ